MIAQFSLIPALLFASVFLAPTTAPSDATAVYGAWIPTQMEIGGAKMPPDEFFKSVKLTLSPGKYLLTSSSPADEGTCTIDAKASPMTFRIDGTAGPNKGRTMLAIFEVSGDTMRVCYDLSGKAFPTEFKTAAGTRLFLCEYKREASK